MIQIKKSARGSYIQGCIIQYLRISRTLHSSPGIRAHLTIGELDIDGLKEDGLSRPSMWFCRAGKPNLLMTWLSSPIVRCAPGILFNAVCRFAEDRGEFLIDEKDLSGMIP
jgi:hypothetical protein